MHYLHIDYPFQLESGQQLDRFTIAYTTHGKLNEQRDNVVWVCHALTGNANPLEWWGELVRPGSLIDPQKHFIVCANMLGSCYGSTGADDYPADQQQSYGLEFPLITTRDMAHAHERLREHLNIQQIYMGIGGSMGGQQLLEWAIIQPKIFNHLCLLATNAKHSPWGIAFNEAQRMALKSDKSFGTNEKDAGRAGLASARAIAMLSYRHYNTYGKSQQESEENKIDDFKASSYQRYQGEKLWQRFSPLAYWTLSKAMDSHNIARGRGSVKKALAQITAKTLVIGINTDVLFPKSEQVELATYIPLAHLEIINSHYGHDGFLTETEKISSLLKRFLNNKLVTKPAKQNGKHSNNFIDHPLVLPGTETF